MKSVSNVAAFRPAIASVSQRSQFDIVIRKLRSFDHVADEDVSVLASAVSGTRSFDTCASIVTPGKTPPHISALLEGWAGRYKILRNGARQITALYLPGDFIDLHSFLPTKTDDGVIAFSGCKTAQVSHESLQQITETEPRLTRLLWRSTLAAAATHREWLTIMGQMSAGAGTAHLICELYTRLKAVRLADNHRFCCPITQLTLADTLGLSTVHLNRSIQALRAKNLIQWHRDKVTITDWDQLVDWGEFDPTYLQMNEPVG
ncbi:Crp/Fnr family transcriptional regulator [Lichenifustis flavocetrariae]|uniref:Crp/Fnr family transcriptional regulator n=1 Tax=Lichenifustis flavocetrariae TaxID=2949735 RepID=A0AA42CN70_9HYPH|nr:Crp/Fnr family transcriptional regulator [Lichenifustis flavocetrariae]MCW6512421.1 Crp/Fnr family transcriptional regulator [Lichenifustis flavocetrariae]